MPLIRGYSDATRSRNIATLRREGYPEKRAVAAAYRIQRQELAMSKRRAAHRRSRRHHHSNPLGGKISWGWLGAGAAAGAAVAVGAGYYMQTSQNKPAPTTAVSAANAATGAGLGLVVVGLARAAMKKHSGGTALAGVLGGGALLGVAFLASQTPAPALPAAPAAPATATASK